MKETINTIIKWHKETEETNEFLNTAGRKDLLELADMVIVCAGIMRFSCSVGGCFLQNTYAICWEIGKYDMTELWEAVEKKMQKNRKRVWNKTAEGTYHHENGIED